MVILNAFKYLQVMISILVKTLKDIKIKLFTVMAKK